ncbi:suppressor of fused domain protein [Enhygromyxa salina]|uniref:Suppressor of fused protein n=1 Tax=Enhygromyxa salina TaxID=215803 RepID=A0A2S9XL77_9BACT|nr:suppressor of fused domain protein [Enhygromyxa salina]PRP93490.1 Suppressor of fused protein [Enhygromyxa salina]
MSEAQDDDAKIPAPGWDAIDRWVGAHFGGQIPHQFTSRTAYELETQNPLPAVTVWATSAPAGWLYVTYGLSELFDKTSSDPSVSGFGFELSMRLPAAASVSSGERPPAWPLRLLQSIGRHVLSTGASFDSGHAIDLGASLVAPDSDGPQDCALTGLICLPDPLLGKINTAHGSLLFLRLFGVAPRELEILDGLELGDLVACIAELSPFAITDPARASFTEDPECSKVLRRYALGITL